MSEENAATSSNEELVAMIKNLTTAAPPQAAATQGGRRGRGAAAVGVPIQSVAIPVMLKDNGEKIRTFVFVDGSGISSDLDILDIADKLAEQGLSVEFWKEQRPSGRSGGGGYNKGGGRY